MAELSPPLAGVTVVEAGRYISAPYAAMILADLGATVIKVEDPRGGDPFRAWTPGRPSPRFVAFNHSKRSIALDLRERSDAAVLRAMLAKCDVFIHNFRASFVLKQDLSYASLADTNPGLVYAEVSGAAGSKSLDGVPMYDAIAQALSGMNSVIGTHAQPSGPSLADMMTGTLTAMGVLAALFRRNRTGHGEFVAASMLHASGALLTEMVNYQLLEDEVPDPLTRVRQSQTFAFTCSDGAVLTVHLSTPNKFWSALIDCLDAPGLLADDRFLTYSDRVAHYVELREALEPHFRGQPRNEWLQQLRARDIPCAPTLRIDEAIASEAFAEMELVTPYSDWPQGTGAISPVPRMAGLPLPSAPPELDQDADWVHAWLSESRQPPSEGGALSP